jgi:predicted nuclease of predicted toxin-antitoxin system
MRFLANENVPLTIVLALGESGHDVVWIRTAAPGITDDAVLAWAAREKRILLTFDKDFGELAARTGVTPDYGVILARVPAPKTVEGARRLADLIGKGDDWPGHFSVIESGCIRIRRMPNR